MERFLFSLSYQVDCHLKVIRQSEYTDHLIRHYSCGGLIDKIISLPAPVGEGYNQEFVELLGVIFPTECELYQTKEFGPFTVDEIRLTIGYIGFMTIEVYCSLHGGLNLAGQLDYMERSVQGMADYYSSKCGFYDSVISELSDFLVKKSDFYYGRHVSVDKSLEADASYRPSSMIDRYIYTYHLFTDNVAFAEDISAGLGIDGVILKVGQASTRMHFGFHLWLLNEKPEIPMMRKLVNCCIVAAWEVLIYDTGAINYKYMLQLVVEKHFSNNDIIRQSINHDNLIVTELSSLLRDLGAEELNVISQCREEYRSHFRKDTFEKAQEYIRYATDGIEEKKLSKTSNVTKIVLTVLTSMSVYSVIYDGYSLLFSGNTATSIGSISSLLFSLATLMMILITICTIRFKD